MNFFHIICFGLFSLSYPSNTVSLTTYDIPLIQTIKIPGSSVEFRMVGIPGGIYNLGPQGKQVNITLDSFWIGITEVSYGEYIMFRQRNNDSNTSEWEGGIFDVDAIARPSPPYEDPSHGMGAGENAPAVSMTQQAALRYCEWLYMKTGVFFRLPTEAEWEVACKTGMKDAITDSLDEFAWYYENSSEKYHPVAEKIAFSNGLYDMFGNVAEWTLDEYIPDYLLKVKETSKNPWMRPSRKHPRTVKGGSYLSHSEECTCESRLKSSLKWQRRDPQIPKSRWWNPDSPFVGFRIVSPIHQPSPREIEEFFKIAIKD